ncbi:MAG: BACON domain-containing protein, partial [Alistipes sp.]|nr:BACON domain-containing protein [Alistipes sp.]
MRIFNPLFAFAALVCVGLLSACENDPATNDPQNDSPVINISDTTLDVSAEGGDYTIELSITNAIGDVKVAATSEAEWLTVKEITQTAVVVNAAFNTEESARQTTLTIKYPQAEDVIIGVTQAAKDGEPYTLEIKDVTYNKFVSDVTAQNDENYYVVYSSTVSYFQEMAITDADALLVDDYNFFSQYAGAYGMGLQDFMVQYGLVRKGDVSVDWTSLVPAE